MYKLICLAEHFTSNLPTKNIAYPFIQVMDMPNRKLALLLPGPTQSIVIARMLGSFKLSYSKSASVPLGLRQFLMILFLNILVVNQGLNSLEMWMRDTYVITVLCTHKVRRGSKVSILIRFKNLSRSI